MYSMKTFFWDKKSQLELWFDNLELSSLDFIRFASFFGIAFLLGLLFKRWSKYIILISILLTIVFALLQGFSIISINFTTIQRLTGFNSITNMQSMFLALVSIVKNNTWEFSCSGIGFVIGFKTG